MQPQYLDFHNIQIPWIASEQVTDLQEDGTETVVDIKPYYIVNLEKYLETGSEASLTNGLLSMTKEALLSLVRNSSFVSKGWHAPLAVSAGVPAGHCYLDYKGGRIIVNEMEGIQSAQDADGDNAPIHLSEDSKFGVLTKFPITSQPPVLQIMEQPPVEVFYDLKLETVRKQVTAPDRMTPAKEQELFMKAHREQQTGLLTSAWNCYDLWKSSHNKMTWEQKMEFIYNSVKDPVTGQTQRYLDIEEGDMKASRKEGKTFGNAKILSFGAGKGLAYQHAWALTSCSSIGELRPDGLAWFADAKLPDLMQDILNLKVDYRIIRPQPNQVKKIKPYIEDGLLGRLLDLGLVGFEEIPHFNEDLPPAIAFWLQDPSGNPCALTDVKRDGHMDEGMTYLYVMAPVFDNHLIPGDDSEDGICSPQGWTHPINHLQKLLSTFDSAIKYNAEGGTHLSHYFPKNLEEWQNPLRKEKVGMLYKVITDLLGVYGDPAPAYRYIDELGNTVTELTEMAKSIVSMSVVIDYGSDMTWEEMYPIAKVASKDIPICIVGSKSTNRRVRKYMLANEYGGSVLDWNGEGSLHRGAKQRSQLLRSLMPVTMTVAITKMDTLGQVLITGKGIAKQKTDLAFLPQVFNTRESYETFLEAHSFTEETCPATEIDYFTWTGQSRRCWTIDGKNSIAIGKLIDPLGNKFMPRYCPPFRTTEDELPGIENLIEAFKARSEHKEVPVMAPTEWEEVDLLCPVDELIAKGCINHFLKKAKEANLRLPNGEIVTCLVCEHTFFRSGSASENIPARWRQCRYKGLDSFPIWWQISKIRQMEPRTCDTEFAEELQACVNNIRRWHKATKEEAQAQARAKTLAMMQRLNPSQ